MIHVTAVDPDIRNLSFGYLSWEAGRFHTLKVRCLKIGPSLKGVDAAVAMCRHPGLSNAVNSLKTLLVVEGQDTTYTGRTNTAKTSDLMGLSLVAGAVISQSESETVYHPTPHAWKGSVPKHINQTRTLSRLGIKYTMKGGKEPYPVPLQHERFCLEDNINPGDWKDINDALGMALWGLEKYLRENRLWSGRV